MIEVPVFITITAIALFSAITPTHGLIEADPSRHGPRQMTWAVDDNLVTWPTVTAQPGEIGNTVLLGHNYGSHGVFRNIPKIKKNDVINIDSKYFYEVEFRLLIPDEPENASWVLPKQDQRLTLVASAPDNQYYIVVAKPVYSHIDSNSCEFMSTFQQLFNYITLKMWQ